MSRSLQLMGAMSLLLGALLLAEPAFAQATPIQITSQPGPGGGTTYSVPV